MHGRYIDMQSFVARAATSVQTVSFVGWGAQYEPERPGLQCPERIGMKDIDIT